MIDNSGLILFDKPIGMTSRDVDNFIMKKFSSRHVGHLGTLDPFASGLLIIGINQGTKLLSIMEDSYKSYEATLKLGEKTDTGDNTGSIIETSAIPLLSKELIESVFQSFIGNQKQIPPVYSAKKINGIPSYKLARKNEQVELRPIDINITDLRLNSFSKDSLSFSCTVSKGTYIRTLGEDLAKKINTVGHLIFLRRTMVNNITMDNKNNISTLDSIRIIPLVQCIKLLKIKTIILKERYVGQKISINIKDNIFIALDRSGEPLAIYTKLKDNIYKVKRGFSNEGID